MQEAGVALVLTPSPDLQAVRTKLLVIRTHQLHEPKSMERDVVLVLEKNVDLILTAAEDLPVQRLG